MSSFMRFSICATYCTLSLNEVLEQLESYRKKEQQIELLRYELQHAKQVSPTELIEAMTFQTRDADGSQTDLYPKDVPGIALSYQHIAAQLNEEAVAKLFGVEKQ